MLCQHCNQNEATCHFVVSNGYETGEVHLCAECVRQMEQAFLKHLESRILSPGGWQLQSGQGWSMPAFGSTHTGSRQAAGETEEEFRSRRRLSELRARLQQAVDREDYEAAAKLRDEIGSEKNKRQDRNVKHIPIK